MNSVWDRLQKNPSYLSRMIKLKPLINETLSEEFRLDPAVKREVERFVRELIAKGVLGSYHRERTGGDMNPGDFAEDLVRKISLAISSWTQTMNNRDNWENQPNMIK